MKNKTNRHWVLLALAAITAVLFGTLMMEMTASAGGGLVVHSYVIKGNTIMVRLINQRPATVAAASATADLGTTGQEAGASLSTMIGENGHATVVIPFSGGVVGIIEGPDPIPQ